MNSLSSFSSTYICTGYENIYEHLGFFPLRVKLVCKKSVSLSLRSESCLLTADPRPQGLVWHTHTLTGQNCKKHTECGVHNICVYMFARYAYTLPHPLHTQLCSLLPSPKHQWGWSVFCSFTWGWAASASKLLAVTPYHFSILIPLWYTQTKPGCANSLKTLKSSDCSSTPAP